MPTEDRVIKASLLAGATDIIVGLVMHFLGLHDWWWQRFRTFGVLGIGMLAYGFWHRFLYWRAIRP